MSGNFRICIKCIIGFQILLNISTFLLLKDTYFCLNYELFNWVETKPLKHFILSWLLVSQIVSLVSPFCQKFIAKTIILKWNWSGHSCVLWTFVPSLFCVPIFWWLILTILWKGEKWFARQIVSDEEGRHQHC